MEGEECERGADTAVADTIGVSVTAAERLKRKRSCMESSAYPMLFSPIKVGTTEVKNRVFMPPVSTNLADHGYVTDDGRSLPCRAKGGVGLIITEVVTVEPTYTYLPGDMCCYDDTFIPGWEKLAAAVHEYGCQDHAAALPPRLHGL